MFTRRPLTTMSHATAVHHDERPLISMSSGLPFSARWIRGGIQHYNAARRCAFRQSWY